MPFEVLSIFNCEDTVIRFVDNSVDFLIAVHDVERVDGLFFARRHEAFRSSLNGYDLLWVTEDLILDSLNVILVIEL